MLVSCMYIGGFVTCHNYDLIVMSLLSTFRKRRYSDCGAAVGFSVSISEMSATEVNKTKRGNSMKIMWELVMLWGFRESAIVGKILPL